MKVVFDGYWWHRGTPSLQRVVTEMATTWARCYPEDEIVLYVRRPAQVKSLGSQYPDDVTVHETRIWPQAAAAMFHLPSIARRAKADLILGQNFTPITSRRTFVLVHDVLFVTNPEWFTRLERAYFSLILLSARFATVVLASTKSEEARIAENVPRVRKVEAVGLGVSTDTRSETRVCPDSRLANSAYLLSVGRLNVRKNLAVLMDAAERSGVLSAATPLVIVGSPEGKGVAVSAAAQTAIDQGRILFTGHVSADELAWLYAHARLFLYLSLDEGFGLPPLEAIAHGAPVVVSDIRVFRETMSDHNATFVNPRNIDEVATAIATGFQVSERLSPALTASSLPSWESVVESIRHVIVSEQDLRPLTADRRRWKKILKRRLS